MSNTWRIYRSRVMVNDRPHMFEMMGDPLHVEASRLGVGQRAPHIVDFWWRHDDGADRVRRTFMAVGTGHTLPPNARYWGTTSRTADGFVWHLIELPEAELWSTERSPYGAGALPIGEPQ